MTRGVVLLFAAALGLPGRLLVAQCPDGSPPPCASARAATPSPQSVAVLPFANRARDTTMSLLAEGLADEIATSLGAIERLRVSSPGSVRFVLARGSRDPRRIGAQLGARWLVDGQLLPSRGNVRVSVQLVDAAAGRVRWSGSFQRATDDLLAVISSIGDSVATAIVGTLAPDERAHLAARPTHSAPAYEAYLRGRALQLPGANPQYFVAVALLESAVRLDSGFSAAWAALATIHVSIADNLLAPRDAYPKARAAANRALLLDPGNGEATAALAKIAVWYDWDIPGALVLARRAVALDPRSPETHLVLGMALVARRDTAEGARELLRAIDLDSLSGRIIGSAGLAVVMSGQRDSLVLRARRLLRADPGSVWARLPLIRALDAMGRCDEVRAMSENVPRVQILASNCSPWRTAEVDSALAVARTTQPYVRAWSFARLFVQAGSPERALDMLEQAFRDREAWLPFLELDPGFEGLHADPRFQDLVRRVAAAAGSPGP